MKYRLGLDIGTNSLGWCVLEINDENEPIKIVASGVRIFSDGRENKSKATLKASRREARSARRGRDRFIQRRTFLLDELTKHGLFSESINERLKLQKLTPLELRATALTEELPLYHFGRALLHLNQRRGFKSNRKDTSEDNLSGKISRSARKLLEQMELIDPESLEIDSSNLSKSEKKQARQQEAQVKIHAIELLKQKTDLTYGSFLWNRQKDGLTTRARPQSDGKLYDIYPTRELIQDEFEKMWKVQARFHPNVLTDGLSERIFETIFFQRNLKPQPLGECSYFPKENRTYRAMPSFQRFRIYQEVNNLEWSSSRVRENIICHKAARDTAIEMLERPSIKKNPTYNNAAVSFHALRIQLKKMDVMDGNCKFNFESESRRGFEGNQTANIMQHEDYVGQQWHSWPLEKQDDFISKILDDDLDDDDVVRILAEKFGLLDHAAHKCVNARLVPGTANLSIRASRILTEFMRDDMLIQSEAVERASQEVSEFKNPYKRKSDEEVLDELPYYGRAVKGHIIPGNPNATGEQGRIGMVSNPTVHIAMNQIRHVINDLIKRFGHPYSIAIELARDLPAGKEGRSEIEREQNKNRSVNVEIDTQLEELGQNKNRDNRLRMRLWKEQDHQCIFTGKTIGCAELFTQDYEIEHLIPFSKSLDDSRSNKVICTRQSNRDKGNRTPFQAFGHNPPNYDWNEIYDRVRKLPKPKQWRFEGGALQIWYRDHDDFTTRHLNDTRYIGRLAKEYLENICPSNRIDVLTGRLTYLLRHHWGLNGLTQKVNQISYGREVKSRDDHRHHAVDAIVVAMTNRSTLQKVATAANRSEQDFENRLFPQWRDGRSSIEPWKEFRKEVKKSIENITVSHKVRRKQLRPGTTDGELHNQTAYGLISGHDKEEDYSTVVVRRPVEEFTGKRHFDMIRDVYLRKKFQVAFQNNGKAGVRNLAAQMEIRSLRCVERKKVIPISDRNGKIYKAYQGDSNWGIEIYSFPLGHLKFGKWEGVVISRFKANKPDFQPGSTYKPHPAAKLVMRLQINDCIEVEENGVKRIMRLVKMSLNGQMEFASHTEANVDMRNRNKDDAFQYWNKTANPLRTFNARKVHVSSTGLVSHERRDKRLIEHSTIT